MADINAAARPLGHEHRFLGAGHENNERRTWSVIWLCSAMMTAEIVGGLMFGSIALVADGLHMSTHAGALLLAAMAYRYARQHANDPRFTFGTGKLGDLAGFSSAIVLAMIAMLILYEAANRLLAPTPIDFNEAIPIAALGLAVNIASVWLLGGDHRGHAAHEHGRHGDPPNAERRVATAAGPVLISVVEDGAPARFRLRAEAGRLPRAADVTIETERSDGARQIFAMAERGGYLESTEIAPEPHDFTARVRIARRMHDPVRFEERHHGAGERDNNMRAAVVHVMADAAVSMLVIAGLLLGRFFGWVWMDAVAGLGGAFVILSWSYALIKDTASILLDMAPDQPTEEELRRAVEAEGDALTDFHLWRLGPGHLGAIFSIITRQPRGPDYFRARLKRFPTLSHVTIEVRPASSQVECGRSAAL